MTTLLITHSNGLAHDMGARHPESPERLQAIARELEHERFQPLRRAEAPKAEREALLRAHDEAYVRFLERSAPHRGRAVLDADTVMCPHTLEAALTAAGGALAAVDAVMRGEVDNAFVAMRPPGHHAGARPMGFCFLNNVAVAARHARAAHGAERVAIVDFDVHHGNGTQEIFWSDKSVMYCSTHQAPFYPGTGWRNETGESGAIVNAPLCAGADGEVMQEALAERILPRLDDFSPDLLLISAGFDAHKDDPLGGLRLDEKDFSEITKRLMQAAERSAKGRVVSVLEGGYNLDALGRSAAAHVCALMGGG